MQEGKVVLNKFLNGVNTDMAEDLLPNVFLSNGHNIKFTNDDNKQGIVQKQESYIKQLNGYGTNLKPLAAKVLNNVIYIVSYNLVTNVIEYGTYPSVIVPPSPTIDNVVGLTKQYVYAPLPNHLVENVAYVSRDTFNGIACTSPTPINITITTSDLGNWTVEDYTPGLTLSTYPAANNTTLTITVQDNPGIDTMAYYVDVRSMAGSITTRINITQIRCSNARGSFSTHLIEDIQASITPITVHYIPGLTTTGWIINHISGSGHATFSPNTNTYNSTFNESVNVTLDGSYNLSAVYNLIDIYSGNILDTITIHVLPGPPSVTTNDASAILSTSAQGNGSVDLDNGSSILDRWFMVGATSYDEGGTTTGIFSKTLTSLAPNTLYTVQAFARNAIGTSHGDIKNFTTLPRPLPTITIPGSAQSITMDSAVIQHVVSNDGLYTIVSRGVAYSTFSGPDHTSPHVDTLIISPTAPPDSILTTLTGLSYSQLYYVRAWIEYPAGVFIYSNEISFTTASPTAPILDTTIITSLTSIGANAASNITSNGGAGITERGFVWSLSANPTTSDTKNIEGGLGTGEFNTGVGTFIHATTYHIRSYAINSAGTGYGADVSFTTLAIAPTVTTDSYGTVHSASAYLYGTVTNSGGGSVNDKGFQLSLDGITWGSYISVGTGIGAFSYNATLLSAYTIYYFRAYAMNVINSVSTYSYGSVLNFKTLASVITVSNAYPYSHGSTIATIRFTATWDTALYNVIGCGISIDTYAGDPGQYHLHSTKVPGSLTNGISQDVNVTGLSPNTTYYVNAYAELSPGLSYVTSNTNETGTYTHDTDSFTTLP